MDYHIADSRFIVHDGDAGWYAKKTAIMDSGNVIGDLVEAAIPEPATIALLGLGLGFIVRHKRK